MSSLKTGFVPIGFTILVLMSMMVITGATETAEKQKNELRDSPAEISSLRDLPDERPIAFVRRFKPNVRIFNLSEGKYIKAEKAERLYDGDTLATGETGYAAVQFMDNSLAKVKPNSLLLINGSVDNDTQSTSTRILLNAGEIMMDVKRDQGDFEVATQTSVATVKGTRFGSSTRENGESFHYVLEGTVQISATGSSQTVTISDGEFARVGQGGQKIETGQLESGALEKRNKEFEQFDQKLEPSKLRFEFRDQNGEQHRIEVDYYENEDN